MIVPLLNVVVIINFVIIWYELYIIHFHYKGFKFNIIIAYDSSRVFNIIIVFDITIYYSCAFQLAEHYINQNNSIDIYQSYFTDPSCQKMQTLAPSFRTVAVMSDPREPTRPVQNISWSPDQGTLVAVSYADMRFQMTDPDTSCDSFIFDLGEKNR